MTPSPCAPQLRVRDRICTPAAVVCFIALAAGIGAPVSAQSGATTAGATDRRTNDSDTCQTLEPTRTAISNTLDQYVEAWLANDPDAVMATLTSDIVLQPHHGGTPVVGADAVRGWWFPSGPPTVITSFLLETRAIQACGPMAYAWGRSSVEWDYEGQHYSNEGNSLSILRRNGDGAWLIAHQIWNDPPADVR